ncbi:MAG TPA: hypothetical protein VHN37_04920 [Actinomycetota bacterium]|nr:hypothetical protein [Actinomycetota bacterium]
MPGGWTIGARRTVCLVAALSLVVLPFDSAPPARGAETLFPLTSFADMHVDQERRHVLVSGGPESSADAVFVFGFDGRQVARIDGLLGAADLLPDGDLLYVALARSNEIAVVDLATLEVADRIDVTPYVAPRYLSKSRDTIYFTHSCVETAGELASIDLTARIPIPHEDARLTRCAEHAVVPSDPDTMFVWDANGGSGLARFNVAARAPVFVDQSPADDYVDDVTFSSDGETFYVRRILPVSRPAGVERRRIADYVAVVTYPRAGGAYAVSPDERYVYSSLDPDGDLAVHRAGLAGPVARTDLDGTTYPDEELIVPGSMRAPRGGDRVFALTATGYTGHRLRFRVIWPQYRIAAGRGEQSNPGAGSGYLLWSVGRSRGGDNPLMARKRGKAFRVNPPRTSGYPGSVDGTKLVYQQVRGQRSDLRLYDVKRRRQVSTLDRMNTPGWEWHPSLSRGRVLFTRQRGKVSHVIVQSLRGGGPRILATARGQSALVAGQISGSFAVWTKCGRTCDVYRINLGTGARTKMPRPARRINYGGSVTRDGTVYYLQSGYGCGTNAEILRFAGGRVTQIEDYPPGRDGFFTHADDANDRVLFETTICTPRGTGRNYDVVSFRDSARTGDAAGARPTPDEGDSGPLPPLEGEPWFDDLLPGGPR